VLPLVVHQNGSKELGYRGARCSRWSFTRTDPTEFPGHTHRPLSMSVTQVELSFRD
jgi:hypothetical protein